jgi:hypothetical protein
MSDSERLVKKRLLVTQNHVCHRLSQQIYGTGRKRHRRFHQPDDFAFIHSVKQVVEQVWGAQNDRRRFEVLDCFFNRRDGLAKGALANPWGHIASGK